MTKTVGVGHSRRYCNTGYDQSQGRRPSTLKCIGPISKGDIEPNHSSEINPKPDSRSRSDGGSRRFVQYRVDQSQGQRPRSLLSLLLFRMSGKIKMLATLSVNLFYRVSSIEYIIYTTKSSVGQVTLATRKKRKLTSSDKSSHLKFNINYMIYHKMECASWLYKMNHKINQFTIRLRPEYTMNTVN